MSTQITDPSAGGGKADGTQAGKPFAGTFTIEFGNAQNGTVICPITRRVYRGRWDNQHLRGRVADDKFAGMPDLPGLRLTVDGRAKTVTVTDPLADPVNRETLKEAKAVYRACNWGDPEPEPVRTFGNLTPDKLKLWVYWCRRWLDSRDATEVRGQVPEMAAVEALEGRVERNLLDSSHKREKWDTDPNPYEPPRLARDGKGI